MDIDPYRNAARELRVRGGLAAQVVGRCAHIHLQNLGARVTYATFRGRVNTEREISPGHSTARARPPVEGPVDSPSGGIAGGAPRQR